MAKMNFNEMILEHDGRTLEHDERTLALEHDERVLEHDEKGAEHSGWHDEESLKTPCDEMTTVALEMTEHNERVGNEDDETVVLWLVNGSCAA